MTIPAAVRRRPQGRRSRLGTGGAGQAAGGSEHQLGGVRRIEPERAQRAEHPVGQLVGGERPAGRQRTQPEPAARPRGPARSRPSPPSRAGRGRPAPPRTPALVQQLDRRVGRAAVHQDVGHRASSRSTTLSAGSALTSAMSTARCREKPLAVGTAPASTRGQQRLVELDDRARSRAAVGAISAISGREALGQRLTKITTGAGVGQHLVAARVLQRRGQRPRPGDASLDRALRSPGPAPRAGRGRRAAWRSPDGGRDRSRRSAATRPAAGRPPVRRGAPSPRPISPGVRHRGPAARAGTAAPGTRRRRS